MRIATTLMYAGDPVSTVDHVVALEGAGLDVIWVPEVYTFDAATLMGYLAAKTEKVHIGSAITPIYSRTPALIGMTFAGLDSLSGGRAILGLGASGPQVIEGWHGVKYDKPIGRTREIIDICRMLWRREKLIYQGKSYTLPLPEDEGTGLGKPLKLINHPVRPNIPVWVAALGPKNVEMTAEIADGWMPILFHPEKANDVWGESIASGNAKRDADLGTMEITAGGAFAIAEGEERKQILDFTRHMVALYVGGMGARGRNFYNDLFSRYGYEAEAKEIQDLYLDGKKDEAAAKVPFDFLEETNLVGSESFIKERIAAFEEAGVTMLNIVSAGKDGVGELRQLKSWVS